MTTSQKITLRISEVRERLNSIAGLSGADFTEDIRSEGETLRKEFSDLEARHRAAIIAENEAIPPVDREDGEGAEIRSLIRKAKLSSYVLEAWGQNPLAESSPESELRTAMLGEKAAPGRFPWAALAGPEALEPEKRSDVATALGALNFPNRQTQIIRRVFAASAAQFLGVSMPTVPTGTTAYPLLTAGATAENKTRGVAQNAVAATFSSSVLTPTRITARYLFSVEDSAQLDGMDDTLRADLSSTVSDAIDLQSITGNGTAPNVSGILTTITAPTTPSDVFTWADAVKSVTGAVDGKYAATAADVGLLVPSDLYPELSTKTMTAGVTRTALEYLADLSSVRVSGNLPVAPTTGPDKDVSTAIVTRRLATGAVAPIWEGVEIVRDPYTAAASGQVALTIISLWNFKVIREDSFDLRAFKLV